MMLPFENRARWLPLLVALVCGEAVFAAEEPRVRVTWVDVPPVLDGRLDDDAWQGVPVIDRFTQAFPDEGEPVTERTEVRIVTDGETLFFGVRLHDSEIDRLLLNRGKRDDRLLWDDRFNVILDTFHDHRNGYFFQVNAIGQRRDALIEGSNFENDWNGIWYAEATIDEHGWTVEIALPFKSVAFDPNGDTWGLNLARGIRRNTENSRWADATKDRMEVNLCCAGVLEGMSGISHGLGLDLVPGFAVRRRDRPEKPAVSQTKKHDTIFDPTFDAFYRLTPGLTAGLSVNTDFGDAEADQQLVNLDRFALFFPEKRAFFLRDALVFDFGGLSSVFNEDPNGLPFFSRRIGLEDDIDVAGKITGRYGPWNIGLLDAQLTGDSDNLFVGRISRNVLGESRVGIIVTNGDPESSTGNSLFGADFQFRDGDWRGTGRVLESNWWFQNSFTDGEDGAEAAWGAELRYPNDRHSWTLGYKELQGGFKPALGFVNRSDIRRYAGTYRFRRWPGSRIRTLAHRIAGHLVTDRRNTTESGEIELIALEITNAPNDRLVAAYSYRYERRDAAGPFVSNSFIPSGRYHFHQARVTLESSFNRKLRSVVEVRGGQFFSGERAGFRTVLEWRPSWHYFFSVEYEQDTFWMDLLAAVPPPIVAKTGKVHSRLARLRVEFSFTKDVSWSTFVQYDNQSDQIGINSRLHWIVEDGREIFVVLNQGLHTLDGKLIRGETEAIFKVGWTLRF